MLSRSVFDEFFSFLSEVKLWRPGPNLGGLIYGRIAPLIDDQGFVEVINAIAEQEFAKPDAIIREVKARRLREQQEQFVALPPGADKGPEICPEMAKFILYGKRLKAARLMGQPLPSWDEVAHEPTPDNWRDICTASLSSGRNPVEAVLGSVAEEVWFDD
ncbi:MAG: hypothetical protein ACHWZW_02745 [Spirulina sp.]